MQTNVGARQKEEANRLDEINGLSGSSDGSTALARANKLARKIRRRTTTSGAARWPVERALAQLGLAPLKRAKQAGGRDDFAVTQAGGGHLIGSNGACVSACSLAC